MKNDVLFDREQSLWTNKGGLIDFTAFTIAAVQRDGESIPVRATRDLTKNQISTWEIGNYQGGTSLSAATIRARKWNYDDFAGYRFDHAASSSGEFQSRPRTDSLSSAPLNPAFSSESFEVTSFRLGSGVLNFEMSIISNICLMLGL